MTITLQAIEAKHAEVTALLAAYKLQQPKTYGIPEAVIDLAQDEHYAGIVLDDEGDPAYHLILLPGEIEDSKWKAASAWAAKQGGELPTRREQALLFANLKGQFAPRAYWSADEYESESSYAWCQSFYSGYQGDYRKCDELRARAVRRLPI